MKQTPNPEEAALGGLDDTVAMTSYPIGTPGVPWGAAERASWLSRQPKLRSYADEVVTRIERLAAFDVQEYGTLDYPPDHYRLLALRSREALDNRPWVLVTGGVHGYETSGVHGALQFLEQHAAAYPVNLVAVPCMSPSLCRLP